MIFIDGSNLLRQSIRYAENTNKKCHIDLLKLRDKLKQNYNLIRVYFYGSIPPEGRPEKINSQIKFYHFLEFNGFDVTYFPLRKREEIIHCPACNKDTVIKAFREKGIDVALVTDMLSLAWNNSYDVVILVAGDLDYREALNRIKQKGIKVKIAFFKSLTSPDLIRCADEFINIEDFLDEIQRK